MNSKERADKVAEIRKIFFKLIEAHRKWMMNDLDYWCKPDYDSFAKQIDALHMKSIVDGWVVKEKCYCDYLNELMKMPKMPIPKCLDCKGKGFTLRPATQQEVNDGKAVRE